MASIGLFDLAFRQNEWLAKRQTVIASNISNVNTPGYKAKDITSFEAAMQESSPLAVTHAAHITRDGFQALETSTQAADGTTVLHSNNSVNLESEFMKSGEVMRSYSVNAQIIKAFHRMVLASAKV